MSLISFWSMLAIVFGVVILIAPQILAYIVAFFFILIGINGLLFSGRMKRLFKVRVEH